MSKNLSSNQTKRISKKNFDQMIKDGRIEVQFDARPYAGYDALCEAIIGNKESQAVIIINYYKQ